MGTRRPERIDDIYQDMHKHVSPVSRYKNIASTVYVHAARHARILVGRRLDLERRPKNHRILPVELVRGVQRRALHPELGRRVRGGIMRAVSIRTALDHGSRCTNAP